MSHRSSIPGCGVTFEIVSNIPEVNDHMKFEFTKNKHVKRVNSLKSHLPKEYVLNRNVYLGTYHKFLEEFPNLDSVKCTCGSKGSGFSILLKKNIALKSKSSSAQLAQWLSINL